MTVTYTLRFFCIQRTNVDQCTKEQQLKLSSMCIADLFRQTQKTSVVYTYDTGSSLRRVGEYEKEKNVC